MLEAVFTTGVDEITVPGLTQWDTGQKLKITLSSLPASFQVHFANKRSELAYVVKGTASSGVSTVGIPNLVLQNPADVVAYIYIPSDSGYETIKTVNLPLQRRERPSDYAYTEVELLNYETVVKQAKASAAAAKASEETTEAIKTEFAEALETALTFRDKANGFRVISNANPSAVYPDENSFLKPVSILEPVQAGSGDPYPAGCGAQLFDISSRISTGITVDADDWVTVELDNTSGTAVAYKSVYTLPSTRLVAGKQYVVVTEIKECAGGYILAVGDTTTSNKGQFVTAASYNTTGTKVKVISARDDFSDCVTMLRTSASVFAGQMGKFVFRISILEDTTVTADTFAYMPYANIRAITGKTSAKLTRCGKNLASCTYAGGDKYGVTVTKNEDGYYTLNGTASQSGVETFFRATLPPGTYTLSLEVAGGNCSTTEHTAGQLVYADENRSVASVRPNTTQARHTLTERKDIRVRLFFNGGTTYDNWKIRICLAAGTEPAHEPYRGDTFTFNLGQTVYGGILDWNTGVLTINSKCVSLAGTDEEKWMSGTSTGMPYTSALLSNVKTSTGYPIYGICSHFPSAKGIILSANIMCAFKNYGLQLNQAGAAFLGIEWTVAAWKEYLQAQAAAGTPVQIYYELAEPITVQLAPVQIFALAGLNTVYTHSDGMSLDYNKSLLKVVEELTNAIIALGGNV